MFVWMFSYELITSPIHANLHVYIQCEYICSLICVLWAKVEVIQIILREVLKLVLCIHFIFIHLIRHMNTQVTVSFLKLLDCFLTP